MIAPSAVLRVASGRFLATSIRVTVSVPTLAATANFWSGETETSWVFLPAATVPTTFFLRVSMMLTVASPTLATKACLPSGVMVTLWAPLPVLMVALTLSEETSMTVTSPDLMLVTQISWAETLASGPATKANMATNKPVVRVFEICICFLLCSVAAQDCGTGSV